jgi:hypothetical protein
VLHGHVANVPEQEGHGPSRLRVPLLGIVPGVAVAVDAAGSVPIDADLLTGDDETSAVVLEGDGIGIRTPVTQIFRELFEPPSLAKTEQLGRSNTLPAKCPAN